MSHSKIITQQPAPFIGLDKIGTDGTVEYQTRWVDRPLGGIVTIPGLEYLLDVSELHFCKEPSICTEYTDENGKSGFSRGFSIKDPQCGTLYQAVEETHSDSKSCSVKKPDRGFTLRIFDSQKQQVLRVTRNNKCCLLCPCCLACAHDICVETATGEVLGYVSQRYNGGFKVQNAARETILRIDYITNICCGDETCYCRCENPCKDCCKCESCKCESCKCESCKCCTAEYWKDCCKCKAGCKDFTCRVENPCKGCRKLIMSEIFSMNNKRIGYYANLWVDNIAKANCQCKMRFRAVFPADLDASVKAILIAGGFLLNVLMFEPARRTCNC